jgi:3,4-dihydroxy 2-butanone 4-phosphate synthase / GTP cyclohydrolase II
VAHNAKPSDLVQPGHIFPLTAQPGGVLVRAGHTEAGCDLAQLAGLEPASVICEILKDDGSMARLPDLIEFAKKHNLKIGAIRDLISYRNETEKLIELVADKEVSNVHGRFRLRAYTDMTTGEVHLALSRGEIKPEAETLVRVHEPISVLDFLDSESHRHSFSIEQAMRAIGKSETGVLVLLRGGYERSEVLAALREESRPSSRWDSRLYGVGAQILREVGVGKMKLLANPRRIPSMAGFGLEVTGYVSPSDIH